MVKMTEQEFYNKWSKRLKAATEEMRSGALKVTEAPSMKAVEKQDKMLANLTRAIEEGVWAASLKKYTLEQWKKDFTEKGVPRVSAGVTGAEDKVKKFATWLFNRITTAQETIKGMPDVTLDDSIARMEKFIRTMAAEKFKE